MPITDKTRKMLWGRSGGVCSICKKQLFEDEALSADPSVLGQECHIVGEEDAAKSPRGLDPMPLAERNQFDNLILLCRDHHKIIDDQPEKYTVQELHRIKNEHLIWVRQTLGFDEAKQLDEETYLAIADKVSDMAGFDDWDNFTYLVLAGDSPTVKADRYKQLEELHDWLFKRVYPTRYPALSRSFENFRQVLHDFKNLFMEHVDRDHPAKQYVKTKKFYKIDEWNPELYKQLGDRYDKHVRLLQDLALELTRAANRMCELMREYVARHYRIKEGLLVAQTGTWGDGIDRTVKVSYSDAEKQMDHPYPGLNEFMTVRCQRAFNYGSTES